jgi:hypothetical protein
MNKYNIIAYIINALILLLVSFASAILSKKYNFTSLMTEAFKPETDLEVDEKIQQESLSDSKLNQENVTSEKELDVSDSKIQEESPIDSVVIAENQSQQDNSIIDDQNSTQSIKELIKEKDFWIEVIRLFIVILIGFTIIRYVQ